MILEMILKSFDFQYDFDFQITTSKMILNLILNHLYLGDLILILKSSTYDDFAHLCQYVYKHSNFPTQNSVYLRIFMHSNTIFGESKKKKNCC